jgi:hypothetical protein
MKTIAEIEEDPIEFVQWAKAHIAAEHGNDPKRYLAYIRTREAESRARGIQFVDFSQAPKRTHESFVVREDPPASTER